MPVRRHLTTNMRGAALFLGKRLRTIGLKSRKARVAVNSAP